MAALASAVLANGCSSGGSGGGSATGTATTTLSDPAPCSDQFSHVYVTIQDVEAHISPDATSGFTDLTPNLRNNPIQVDLMSASSTECILATLGDNVGLPAGKYQQIRLQLLANQAPGSGVTPPSPNACSSAGTNVFNCVEPTGGSLTALTTPSGSIKIPPGQLAQGGLTVPAGQAVDIDIDFNACTSVVERGNSGQFNLKPTLRAGELGTNPLISGTVVLGTVNGASVTPNTSVPVPGASVWLEQQSSTVVVAGTSNTEQVENFVQSVQTDSSGKFEFCPVMAGSYDIVADALAMPNGGNPSNATITEGVSVASTGGPNNLVIPLVPDAASIPTTLSGQLSTANTSASGDTVTFMAAQGFSASSGPVQALVPFFQLNTSGTLAATSSPGVTSTTSSGTNCSTACPSATNCACYTATVPASNPVVGAPSADGAGYAAPAGPPTNGAVTASADSESTAQPVCSPSALITPSFTWNSSGSTPVPAIDFTGCD